MPVLSKNDFNKHFANNCQYGITSDPWPNETVIVYSAEWDIIYDGYHSKKKRIGKLSKMFLKECMLKYKSSGL